MIAQSDELLHAPGSSSDWEERFRINFSDKKSKAYGVFDINITPQNGECCGEWLLFIDGTGYSSNESYTFESKEGLKTAGGKNLKYKITGKNSFEIAVKNSQLECKLEVSTIFNPFDFPCAPGRPANQKREEFEAMLWKRYEQRCRVSGQIFFKDGSRKKIDSLGIREHSWGAMLWKHLCASSRYYIQFKEMSVSLSFINFEDSVVSNGFISRKSGNIPVVGIELEHIDIDKTKKLRSSEISYLDSQDDRDLIVTHALNSVVFDEIKAGRRKYVRCRSFSEFSIIGANKKGIGYEEHILLPEKIPTYTGDR